MAENVKAIFDALTDKWFVAPDGAAPIAGPFDTEDEAADWIEDWEDML
jgi:hypothetical protein